MTLDAWPFIDAAYALTAIVVALLASASYIAMRRAERAADEARRR